MLCRSQQIKVFLCGYLTKDSFLKHELKLNSIFDLFLENRKYLENPEQWFPRSEFSISFEHSLLSLEDMKSQLANTSVDRDEAVILWPAQQLPADKEEWKMAWEQLLTGQVASLALNSEIALRYSVKDKELKLSSGVQGHLISIDLGSAQSSQLVQLLSTPARHFNKLFFTEHFLTKHLEDKEKGQAEYYFLNSTPQEVKTYFPKPVSYQEDTKSFSYTLPRFSMLDLRCHMVHGSLTESEWKIIFRNLATYLYSCPTRKTSVEKVRSTLRSLFIDKMERRLASCSELREVSSALNLKDSLLPLLEHTISASNRTELSYSHGDLYFSNILLDRHSYSLKFIDPKGARSEHSAFLPLEYDLAKLSHSVFGGYDWIMSEIPLEKQNHSVKPLLQNELRKLFYHFQINENLVRLGEASLFLSLLPLHKDRPHLHPQHILAAKAAHDSTKVAMHAS